MPWPLIGNARARSILERSLSSRTEQHAYLFAGPNETGRATVARTLAQALNCTSDEPPCGECGQCRRVASGIHSDVHRISILEATDGPTHKDISIEQLREVEQLAALTPYEGRTRVVIIDPAERLTEQAQNAFLKTLEEPPPHVVFILIASDTDALLETVRSRCALVPFSLVPVREIEHALVARGADTELARLLARLARGRPGSALRMLEDTEFRRSRAQTVDEARRLPLAPLADRFDAAEKLSESFRQDRDPVYRILGEWGLWWRDVMLVQAGAEAVVINSDRSEELHSDARSYSVADVRRFLAALTDTLERLDMNVQSRLALDTLMLNAPAPAPSGRP